VRHALLAIFVLIGLVAVPAGAQVPDGTPPDVTCATPGAGWHAGNITIACTATDPETGIPDPADQAFDLTTSVPAGQQTSSASTELRNVCNPVPLCTQAGPISGIKIDRRAPNDPTRVRSTDHRVGKWSRDRTITMAFNAASDGGSGVDGFSRSWTNLAGSTPDNVKDLEQGARQTTSSRLANGRWFFHLKTRDNVGNWTSTVHRGPYLIDATKPRVRALSDSGKRGKKIHLRYRTADNNDRTREQLTLSKGGSVVKRWSKAMGNAGFGMTQSVDWTPKSAGHYRFCVKAWDPAGNARQDCAGIDIKAPAPSGGGGGGGGGGCDPSYPGVCIPPPPPDLDCDQVPFTNFAVRPPDPHGFDGDGDGVGCET
jgi:hypothetical protein